MEFKRCYGCMGELNRSGSVCPDCGYDNAAEPQKQPRHALSCGTILAGHYVVGRVLGQGGFGITYIGWNLALEQRVCIKEYFPSGAAVRSTADNQLVLWGSGEHAEQLKSRRESFVKEARKLAKLSDLAAVVKVWDVFYENDTSYIVMNYVSGKTLKSWLVERGTPIDTETCVSLLDPVMRELERVHERGIIHRDIKPDNLMLQADGKIVLLDLGSAKDLSGGSNQTSYLVASQGFSPLEQYNRNGKIGPWTDVYAMCATIWYCVTGKILPSPTERMSGEELHFDLLPPELRPVLEKGLAIMPESRIQSMAALRAALHVSDAAHTAEETPFAPPKAAVGGEPEKWYGKRYKTAVALMEEGKLASAAALFSSMGSYRDSQELAEQCRERAAQEPEAQAPTEAPQPEKRKSGARMLGAAALVLLAAFAALWIKSTGGKGSSGQSFNPTSTASVDISQYEAVSNELLEEGNRYLAVYEYEKALAAYMQAAAAGNGAAMTNIGYLYENGLGVEKNYETAFEWFRSGAETGDPAAMFWVGWCYYYKLGVEKSYETALAWCLRAAEAGNAEAMNWVSDMYRYGQGTAVNIEKAEQWRQRAVEAGYTD